MQEAHFAQLPAQTSQTFTDFLVFRTFLHVGKTARNLRRLYTVWPITSVAMHTPRAIERCWGKGDHVL